MKEALLERVRKLDEKYFGKRGVKRLIWAMEAQVLSMKKRPTRTNMHKQLGDLLFAVVAAARNEQYDLEELLEDAVTELEHRIEKRHYYEAHVTVEPVFGRDRTRLETLARERGFRVAGLFMQKRPRSTPRRSKYDAFCTARSVSRSDLQNRMVEFVTTVRAHGLKVWRAKIESTIEDTRYDDAFCPLDPQHLPAKERAPRAPADGALPGRRKR